MHSHLDFGTMMITYVGKGHFLLFRGPFTDDDTLPNGFSFEPVKGFRGHFRVI